MKLTPYDATLIARSYAKKNDNYAFIKEFDASGVDCAKIEGYPHKSAASCVSSLSKTISRYKMPWITVTMHKGEVYLIRTSKLKKVTEQD